MCIYKAASGPVQFTLLPPLNGEGYAIISVCFSVYVLNIYLGPYWVSGCKSELELKDKMLVSTGKDHTECQMSSQCSVISYSTCTQAVEMKKKETNVRSLVETETLQETCSW